MGLPLCLGYPYSWVTCPFGSGSLSGLHSRSCDLPDSWLVTGSTSGMFFYENAVCFYMKLRYVFYENAVCFYENAVCFFMKMRYVLYENAVCFFMKMRYVFYENAVCFI